MPLGSWDPHRPHGHRSGREADVHEVRLHDGRHIAATLLLTEGVQPRVVMEVLGHAQMRTTTDTYRDVVPALAAMRLTAWATRCGTDWHRIRSTTTSPS